MRRVATVVGTTLLLATPVLAQNAGSTGYASTGYGSSFGLGSTSIVSSAPALSSGVSGGAGQQGLNPITAGVVPDQDAVSPPGLPNGTVQMLLSPPPASDDDN